jgi:thioredoxin 2
MERHIARNDIPVLVDFWAEWCGPCKAMAPVFTAAASLFEPTIRFLKLDTEAEPAAAARYGIRGIPTMILFANGQPTARQVGATGLPGVTEWLEASLPQRGAV